MPTHLGDCLRSQNPRFEHVNGCLFGIVGNVSVDDAHAQRVRGTTRASAVCGVEVKTQVEDHVRSRENGTVGWRR